MKKCFYVSSCIETNPNAPLSYAPKRSVFAEDERYRQTLLTVNTIKCLSPQATVYILDASIKHAESYKSLFEMMFNDCHYISMKDVCSAEDFELIRSHPNKSLGESIQLRDFLCGYENELKQYDYFFKLSGRYVIDETFRDDFFDETRTNNIFFKTALAFPWHEKWNGMKTDVRKEEGHNFYKQYCSVFYGYGREQIKTFRDMYLGMVSILKQPSMIGYDVETLLYYLTKDYATSIIEMPIRVLGWEGPSGTLMRY